jgi:exonuclease V gamma subunit
MQVELTESLVVLLEERDKLFSESESARPPAEWLERVEDLNQQIASHLACCYARAV